LKIKNKKIQKAMVSKLSFQTFPTAVNIYAAYEHHNKHGRSRSVLLQVNIQYSQDDSSQKQNDIQD
jgi:hypothetical protein